MTASFTVAVPAVVSTVDKHAILTLLGAGGAPIYLPITDPAATYDNLHGNWVEVPRPGLKPFNKRVGGNLATLAISVLIVGDAGGPHDEGNEVEPIIIALKQAADNDTSSQPIAFTWGHFDSTSTLTQTGHWHIDSFTLTTEFRQPGTNNISNATAAITLKEASDEPTSTSNASASWLTPANTNGPTTLLAPVTSTTSVYAVREGDTAYSIAQGVYGQPEPGWRQILAANDLIDPRALTVGQQLIIP